MIPTVFAVSGRRFVHRTSAFLNGAWKPMTTLETEVVRREGPKAKLSSTLRATVLPKPVFENRVTEEPAEAESHRFFLRADQRVIGEAREHATTPAGTFDCVKLETRSDHDGERQIHWMSFAMPGLVVRREIFGKVREYTDAKVLVSERDTHSLEELVELRDPQWSQPRAAPQGSAGFQQVALIPRAPQPIQAAPYAPMTGAAPRPAPAAARPTGTSSLVMGVLLLCFCGLPCNGVGIGMAVAPADPKAPTPVGSVVMCIVFGTGLTVVSAALIWAGRRTRRRTKRMDRIRALASSQARIAIADVAREFGSSDAEAKEILMACVADGSVRGRTDLVDGVFVSESIQGAATQRAIRCRSCGATSTVTLAPGETPVCPYCRAPA